MMKEYDLEGLASACQTSVRHGLTEAQRREAAFRIASAWMNYVESCMELVDPYQGGKPLLLESDLTTQDVRGGPRDLLYGELRAALPSPRLHYAGLQVLSVMGRAITAEDRKDTSRLVRLPRCARVQGEPRLHLLGMPYSDNYVLYFHPPGKLPPSWSW